MFIRIEASSGVAIWRQIADQIRTQCATEVLAGGDKLPSVRALARQLAVNQNTILKVYERLTAEGLLELRHGSGTYVAANVRSGKLEAQQLELLREEAERLVFKARALKVKQADVLRLIGEALARSDGGSPTRKASTSKGKKNA